MIQPQEIRIGNYYQGASRGNIETVTWQTLRDLSEGKINLLPIPLTEEILLKFGFRLELNEKGITIASLNSIKLIAIKQHNQYVFSYQQRYSTIQYLHQLQNLYFALTGEELTFK